MNTTANAILAFDIRAGWTCESVDKWLRDQGLSDYVHCRKMESQTILAVHIVMPLAVKGLLALIGVVPTGPDDEEAFSD